MAFTFKCLSILSAGAALAILAGCANGGAQDQQSGAGWGQSIARYALDKECHTQLNKRTEWQAASLVMSKTQQTNLANKICACAADETAKQLGTVDVVKLISQQQRQKVITDVSVKTVAECSKRLILGN